MRLFCRILKFCVVAGLILRKYQEVRYGNHFVKTIQNDMAPVQNVSSFICSNTIPQIRWNFSVGKDGTGRTISNSSLKHYVNTYKYDNSLQSGYVASDKFDTVNRNKYRRDYLTYMPV